MDLYLSFGDLQTPKIKIPQCKVLLVNESDPNQRIEVDAIVDTGAAKTIVNEQSISSFDNTVKAGKARMQTTTGEVVKVSQVFLNVKISCSRSQDAEVGIQLEHFRVLVLPSIAKPYAILGRDILNDYELFLNAKDNIAMMRI